MGLETTIEARKLKWVCSHISRLAGKNGYCHFKVISGRLYIHVINSPLTSFNNPAVSLTKAFFCDINMPDCEFAINQVHSRCKGIRLLARTGSLMIQFKNEPFSNRTIILEIMPFALNTRLWGMSYEFSVFPITLSDFLNFEPDLMKFPELSQNFEYGEFPKLIEEG